MTLTTWGVCEPVWACHLTESRVYTAVNGYKWLMNMMVNQDAVHSWKCVWNLASLEKFCLFVWLTLHQALPTASFRFQRNLSNSNMCSRCMLVVEDILHNFA